ncbi:MAG TPA: prepilin-type N-terminal cleavage/methylation domain-containing protein [Candidatus Hydrogenedens sp.]|nr:prepilin-type N-terminal cleavage/methylation domain-containing protein [Candidatus Hydrogenedens sp.]
MKDIRLKRIRGFSLIEIITVLAVLAILSTMGVVMFGRIMDYRRQSEIKQSLNISFLQLTNRLQEDFDQIASPTYTKGKVVAMRHIEDERRYQSVPLDDDRISFPVIYTNSEGREVVVQVFYYIDRSLESVPSLVRVIGPLGEEKPSGAREILTTGVLGMRVHCYDGKDWVENWDKSFYPKAVKISLVLADENRLWEQVVRESVFWLGNII